MKKVRFQCRKSLLMFATWFPSSNKQLDMHDDFECYTERFLDTKNNKSQIDIYFHIV
ncbi:GyrI-like domain-containing protein [Clostridium estertheticum]|uniref:GyrI-like domain-containing protein n=1 Tax=Clostridium estertheticum TaxID=238834 RepID=UPI001CF3B15E|nr:GyrI-like domain-containing protein [Clostridium estertheticum]MCB2345030.1 GyrI-like domain-containing protein [Clostridium estertheticum]